MMKKLSLALCPALLAGAFLLNGCHSHTTAPTASIDSIYIERHEPLVPNDTLSPACTLSIRFEYLAQADSIGSLINDRLMLEAFDLQGLQPQAAVDSFTNAYLRRYHHDVAPFYKDGSEAVWGNYTYHLTTHADNSRPDVLNYEITTDIYEGGAHGSHTLTYLNFDTSNGQLLTLDDLFNTGYEEPLTEHLLDALMDKLDVDSPEALREIGYLTLNDMYPTPNFLLKGDSIVFHYNAYEIAPYSAGSTRLSFALDDLNTLLKTPTIKH